MGENKQLSMAMIITFTMLKNDFHIIQLIPTTVSSNTNTKRQTVKIYITSPVK